MYCMLRFSFNRYVLTSVEKHHMNEKHQTDRHTNFKDSNIVLFLTYIYINILRSVKKNILLNSLHHKNWHALA